MTDQQFSTRDLPWLKDVGTEVDEAVTAAGAIELAGLDWDVVVQPEGFTSALTGEWKLDPSMAKIVRADTDTPLGTMTRGYQVLQYREAFDFMDQIHPDFVAAGSMKDGKQAFMVVQAPEYAKLETLDGEDPHDLYVVLRSSHNGTRAIEINLLPLRGACMNMLPVASFGKTSDGYNSQAKQRWSIRHTKNMHNKLMEAQEVLTGLDAYTKAYNETAEKLAAINVELDDARRILDKTIAENIKKRDDQVDNIMDVYQFSTRNGHFGNGWGLVNAVSEYHEHYRNAENRRPVTRWIQGLDGSTYKAINRTVELLRTRS